MLGADLWRGVHDQFQSLADEERVEGAAARDRFVRAYCDYSERPEVLQVRKDARFAFALSSENHDERHAGLPKVSEPGEHVIGPLCLLKTPECGLWTLSEGVNENLQERFQTLATRAGIALGSPATTEPLDFWLHRLFLDLIDNKSALLFAAEKGKGGIIRRVCEASAIFCLRLERKALEASASFPEQRPSRDRRLKATIRSNSAARRMEAYLESKAIGQTEFAVQVGTTDRTLRAFRQTGKVRRDIFDAIAKGMGLTKEELLKS